ncbi:MULTISPECIES: hypothetical protein [Clostridium]|uniref:TetR/AcrR type transcriptional regulator-like C-terminal domain-containing protein n=1 Tax=Clostridium frigoriphilum TaxID=443253 RepID=A0ABU7UI32_9CLOT|nr:hypothetical protein [Clostridium sp. DSM 17811]MBU3098541.1 hypothetical protein [Clostridium sp. DSM 17811]
MMNSIFEDFNKDKTAMYEGIFHTEYPREVPEFILTEFGFVLDHGVFGFSKEQIIKKTKSLTFS